MTKAELTARAVEDAGITKGQAEAVIGSVLSGMEAALKEGDSIMLKGFGTFKVKETKARTGRNPKTGEAMQIPAKKKVVFKASKELLTTKGGE